MDIDDYTCDQLSDLILYCNVSVLYIEQMEQIIYKFEDEQYQLKYDIYSVISSYLSQQNRAQAIYLQFRLINIVLNQQILTPQQIDTVRMDINNCIQQYFMQLNINQSFMSKLDVLVLRLILNLQAPNEWAIHSQNKNFIYTQYSYFVLSYKQDVEEMQMLFIKMLFTNGQFKTISDALLKHQIINQNNISVASSLMNEMRAEIDVFRRTTNITDAQWYNFINDMKFAYELFEQQVQTCILQLQTDQQVYATCDTYTFQTY